MRVIAGKHKGRIIETVSSKKLRPTTGMAREAVFNILAHGNFKEDGSNLLDECRVLDLFSGCGALSIEALSRGASHVTLIDIDPQHLNIARKNISSIGESESASFIRGDSSTPPPATAPCDLIFLDPPYGKGLVASALKNLLSGGWLAKDAVIVVETGKNEDIEQPEYFTQLNDRKYGNSRIRIMQWNG